jgi:hypothetical protein
MGNNERMRETDNYGRKRRHYENRGKNREKCCNIRMLQGRLH